MTQTSRNVAITLCASFAFHLICLAAVPARAQGNIVQVEEHWELRINEPDEDRSAPQSTMVMSPTGDLTGMHFLFTLNHVTAPGFEAGGLQVQLWYGDDVVQESISTEIGAVSHNDEVIRWTQRMTVDDGELTFQIVDGESETWGNFGGDDLTVSTPTSLNKLNGYSPGVSLTESQVSYAENRVASLVLTKLRWIKENGQVYEYNAPIPIDVSLE
jgi:hypothetical protein